MNWQINHPNKAVLLSSMAMFAFLSAAGAVQTDYKKTGRVSNSFLQLSPGARLAALGGQQAAIAGDLESALSNPAGLSTLSTPQLSLYHNDSLLESKFSSLGFALPAKKSVFGFSGQYLNHGSDEKVGIDSSNQPVTGLGSFRYTTTLLNMAWARKLGDKIPVGVTIKGWSEERANSTSQGWAADTGLQIPLMRSLDLGIAGRNLGPKIDGFDLPSSYALGLAYRLKQTTLFSELSQSKNKESVYRGGVEMQWSAVWLRGGYENLSTELDDSLGNFSFGGGLQIKGWKVDYAWIPKGDLGNQQLVTLTMAFGLTPEEREKRAKSLDEAIKLRMSAHAEEELSWGRQALKTGEWISASDRFTKALLWDPMNKEAQDSLKFISNKIEAARSSDEELERAFNAGVGYYLEGKNKEALKEWTTVEKRDPNRPLLREYMGKAKVKMLEQELAELKDKGTKPTQDVEKLSHQAYMLFNLGQDTKAIETWQRILALDPANNDAKAALSKALEKQKLVNNLPVSRDVREVEKMNFEAMNVYLAGDLEKAAGIWRRAVLLDPSDMRVRNNLKRAEIELALKKGKP